MNKEFVSNQQALELQQLGFDEPCIGKFYYNQLEIGGIWTNNDFKEDPDIFISAPLYQQAFRWFREKYDLDSYIMPARLETKKVYDYYIWFSNKEGERDLFIGMNNEYTYEEAENGCLNKLITTLKQKK